MGSKNYGVYVVEEQARKTQLWKQVFQGLVSDFKNERKRTPTKAEAQTLRDRADKVYASKKNAEAIATDPEQLKAVARDLPGKIVEKDGEP